MSNEDADRSDDQRIRESLQRHAPRPSPSHNEAILSAARAAAARKRRSRLIERGRPWTGAGLAAAVLLAAGLWIAGPDVSVDDDVTRGNDAGAEIVPADNARLDRAPSTFRWPSVPETRRYRVVIYDGNASLLWQSDWTTDTALSLDAATAPAMPAQNRFFWRVELDGDGARHSLGPYWFTVE